jgi:putative peptide zinc metalloprotease protein
MDLSQDPDADFALPPLNPLMRLFKSSDDMEGQPRWSLYHPASNKYFHVNWAEFECLARFHQYDSADALIEAVNGETTLSIDKDDIKALILFLQQNGLLALSAQDPQLNDKEKPLWERIVHGYLFFTLPLFKPSAFLKKTLPFVRPLLSRGFMNVVYVLLTIGVFLTLQRFDEFTHTFLDLFSVKGAILSAIIFTAIKIVHEFSHAYVATKHGVNVPHMGVAFIVMYPVFYTETTASWQLPSRKKRMEIGLAGVAAELALAAVFLLLWHVLPPGMARSMCFAVVAISLIGSLFVNLNPLMRFDGYFVLSDALNIENLHARAIGLARNKLRRVLFGLKDALPDKFSPDLQSFMTAFGFAIIIYRFFLFLGIAVLVYAVFFKPLGLILFLLEIFWFIGLPLLSELKVWWERRADILSHAHGRIVLGAAAAAIVFMALPIHGSLSVSGVLHAQDQRSIFPPASARILYLNVQDEQRVKEGEILVSLQSDALEKEYKTAKAKLDNLEEEKRRGRTDIESYRERGAALENKISEARAALDVLERRKSRLNVKAPFDGVIRDLSPEIHEKRDVSTADLLFRVVRDDENMVSAYIGEDDLGRIKEGNAAGFFPDSGLFAHTPLVVEAIDPVNVKSLSRPELASVYGGAIASAPENDEIVPLEPTYLVKLKPLKNNYNFEGFKVAQLGQVHINATRRSRVFSTLKRSLALIVRESGFN